MCAFPANRYVYSPDIENAVYDIAARSGILERGGSTEPCCGVKSAMFSRQSDGSLLVSATGLKDDVLAFLDQYTSSGKITSSERQAHLYTYTKTDLSKLDTFNKIETSGIFKSVPRPILNIYESEYTKKSFIPPTQDPDAAIYLRSTDDPYGVQGGWTVRDIIDTLDIPVSLPASLNYNVYELTVRRGMPIVTLLQSLFPIPGICVRLFHGTYYVALPTREIALTSSIICDLTGEGRSTTTYTYEVSGLQGVS